MVCGACLKTKHHRDHTMVEIEEKAEEIKKQLQEHNKHSQKIKDVLSGQMTMITEVIEDINTTTSTALDDLDNTRDTLYQRVKESIESCKTKVIQNQQKYLKQAEEKKKDIETRKAILTECFQGIDQFIKNDDPIDVIHNSKDILLSVNGSVKVNEHVKRFQTYETKLFQSQTHDNFIEQVVGKLVTEVNKIHMPSLTTGKMPVKGTLVRSWPGGGCSVASSVEGDVYAFAKGPYKASSYKQPYSLKTFDLEGNEKKSVYLGEYTDMRGLATACFNGIDMIVLSTNDSIQIRQCHDGKQIDSFYHSEFSPALNAICMTPDNNILVCSDRSKVIELDVRNMKIVQTQKSLNIPVKNVTGLCHVLHDNRQLVIATSYKNAT